MLARLFLAALSIAAPLPAAAQDLTLSVSQRLVGQLEPMGAEHMLAVGARAPLGDPSEVLFSGAHAEAGVVNYTSPIYTTAGGYLEVSPLAVLVLRAELASVTMWPIGMPGAGYYAVEGDDAPLGADNLAPEAGAEASGWSARLSAVVQAAVPLGPVRLLTWDQLTAEHLSLGEAPYHFYPRYDAVLARSDWVIGNSAMVLAEIELAPQVRLRVGAYDDLAYVPRSGYLANQVGGVAALSVEGADPRVPEIQPFARVGAYSHGRRSGAVTLLLGAMVRYAVVPLR